MRVVKELYRSWCAHRGGALSAELLLFGALSVLPLLLVIAALAGSARSLVGVEASVELERWVLEQVARVLGDGTPVREVVTDLFAQSARSTVTLGLVIALYGSSRAFSSMVGSLDVVFGTSEHRSWIGQRLAGLVIALMTMVAFPSVVVATTYGHVLAQGWVNHLVGLGGYVVAVLWVAALYHWVPKHRTTLREQLVGATVCVALVALLAVVFRAYVGVFGANAVFGVIGALVSLLWFGYFACSAFFLGAEINARSIRLRREAASA